MARCSLFATCMAILSLIWQCSEPRATAQTNTDSAVVANVNSEERQSDSGEITQPENNRRWRRLPFEVSGFLDAYYSFNPNRPTSAANGAVNDLYSFNDKANQVNVSALELSLLRDTKPFGARVDLFYGRTSQLINTPGQLEFVEQSYLSLRPPVPKHLELDFGKFVTAAGAEVIESKDNWNYSRSLLFTWAIPFYHFGLRASLPLTDKDTLGVQLVNGWNNVTKSTGGATVGVTNSFIKNQYTVDTNVYSGPEDIGLHPGYRNLVDMVLQLTPNSRFSAYVNYDYGQQHGLINGDSKAADRYFRWDGVAAACHYKLSRTLAVASRIEYYDDPQGYTTGNPQHIKEFTSTAEYKTWKRLIVKPEYRKDRSSYACFHHGEASMARNQDTLTLGVVMPIALPK